MARTYAKLNFLTKMAPNVESDDALAVGMLQHLCGSRVSCRSAWLFWPPLCNKLLWQSARVFAF